MEINCERMVTIVEDYIATRPLMLYEHYVTKEEFMKRIKLPCELVGEKDGIREYINFGYHIFIWWKEGSGDDNEDSVEIKVVGPDGTTTETGGLIINAW